MGLFILVTLTQLERQLTRKQWCQPLRGKRSLILLEAVTLVTYKGLKNQQFFIQLEDDIKV
ncbi:hypothetical protein ZX61_09325 [Vibrio sp. VPAP30]|uniref:Uncharacterized protein n=1 Tax=Vibrio bivalvicida TaxID=1276888 RepID=A0A177Y0L3_9VIBR|nr:hypothetical protein ZX61_09325 [Vibrio sp. VPAP30]OAJ94388.1 hypothetical protein APB76_09970 [Vibrio bivalvicida]